MTFTIIAIAAVLVIAITGFGLAVYFFVFPTRTAADRVRELTRKSSIQEVLVRPTPSTDAGNRPFNLAAFLARLASPSDEKALSDERLRMVRAGFRSASAFEMYNAIRAMMAILLPALTWFCLPDTKLVYQAFLLLAAASIGYVGPSRYVDSRATERKNALLRPFPDALDLLVTCTEAGLGVDAAFMRVGDEMTTSAPLLASEFQQVNHEVAAGVPRAEALRHLDERTGLQEINSLVSVLIQADRFGTSVAQALRIHSGLVRTRRMLEAEEQAATISPKMTVAMILFLLPTLFVVILGPAVVNVIRVLLPTMFAVAS